MSTTVMSVRIPTELKQQLDALSESTGRTCTFHILRAVEDYLEDIAEAEEAYKEWEADGFATRPFEELIRELELSPDPQPGTAS